MSEGHVSLWHPWKDKPGNFHTLSRWNKGAVVDSKEIKEVSSIENIIEIIGGERKYTFCNDILSRDEFPFSIELIRHKSTQPYISKTGHVVALRIKKKRTSGFLIPGIHWSHVGIPTDNLLDNVQWTFKQFKYEALTPASLSEKVLRATLPDRCFISRPSLDLRRCLLDTEHGGRIDRKKVIEYFERVFEYDINKAYLFYSSNVPNPFYAPIALVEPTLEQCFEFPTFFAHVQMFAHQDMKNKPHPILITRDGSMEAPEEGEMIDRYLWKEEIEDCLRAGYVLYNIRYAYCFRSMSTFMQQWSDRLLTVYDKCENKEQQKIIKSMMVGLPGRFLKRPEIYTLVHESEVQKQDILDDKLIPVAAHWLKQGDMVSTPWYIKVEEDKESAQLTPVGSYITMQCRQAIYRRMCEEVEKGNQIVSSYIDCYRVTEQTQLDGIGIKPGQYKEKEYKEVIAEENRLYGKRHRKKVLKAPSYQEGSLERKRLVRKYNRKIREEKLPP